MFFLSRANPLKIIVMNRNDAVLFIEFFGNTGKSFMPGFGTKMMTYASFWNV
ncbi:hypothetical protein GCM10007877_07050 [Marinibactrum halimedae]|uniref:Uncharacterized protein n=1 Tax=Marinibactrum halimedae TaxID=1444977 RepID=A0AA37T3T1_9GAMM|nr:hypothetical protein GCM10007877_07050 [Marinibactrum halimedae]